MPEILVNWNLMTFVLDDPAFWMVQLGCLREFTSEVA